MDYLLFLACVFGVIWILGLIVKGIINAPKKVIYHISGDAERDKQKQQEAKRDYENQLVEFAIKEKEDAVKKHQEFAAEVKSIEQSLNNKGINDNELIVLRGANSMVILIAIYEKLLSNANYKSFNNERLHEFRGKNKESQFTLGYLEKTIAYIIKLPIVHFDVEKNKSYEPTDGSVMYDVNKFSIAKATPDFVAIYDEKVLKPIRDKAQAIADQKLKRKAAEDKLNKLFK